MERVSASTVASITLHEIDGEPRARDVDIGERLGFARPRAFRQTIERHRVELEAFGPLATVCGKSRGQNFTEYWLNEEQGLLASVLSDAPLASAVRAMLIRTFVAWRRGHLAQSPAPAAPRDVQVAFRSFMSIARLIGLDANECALSANRATIKVTGFDALGAIGATHLIADRQEELLTPTEIGARLDGLSAIAINKRLEALGYQESAPGGHGAKTWHPTDKGKPFGKWLDTGKRHHGGASVQQWKWYASIIPEMAAGTVVALVADAGATAS